MGYIDCITNNYYNKDACSGIFFWSRITYITSLLRNLQARSTFKLIFVMMSNNWGVIWNLCKCFVFLFLYVYKKRDCGDCICWIHVSIFIWYILLLYYALFDSYSQNIYLANHFYTKYIKIEIQALRSLKTVYIDQYLNVISKDSSIYTLLNYLRRTFNWSKNPKYQSTKFHNWALIHRRW